MSNACNYYPLSSAVAGGTVVRVDRSLLTIGVPDMAHRTASFSISRGTLR